jgi:hypothetical protein
MAWKLTGAPQRPQKRLPETIDWPHELQIGFVIKAESD